VPTNDESAILHTEIGYLASVAAGAEYKIHVCKLGSSREVPTIVLYLPDANTAFGLAVQAVRSLQLGGHIPPVLIVGIGYRIQESNESFSLRSRDLTPFAGDPSIDARNWESGRADQFLEFIRTELKPWVASKFDVDPDNDMFFGFSLGGLFGTYVLLTQPDTFKRYGLGSPSLWLKDRAIFKLEAARALSQDDLSATVFFSAGALETPEGDQIVRSTLPERKRAAAEAAHRSQTSIAGEINVVKDMQDMVAALRSRSYPSLNIGSEVLDDEFHLTAAPRCFIKSLRFYFEARS